MVVRAANRSRRHSRRRRNTGCGPWNDLAALLLCKRTVEDITMLGWAISFFILALVAGFLGFFGLAGLAASIAKLLLFAFVILFIVSALFGWRGRTLPPI